MASDRRPQDVRHPAEPGERVIFGPSGTPRIVTDPDPEPDPVEVAAAAEPATKQERPRGRLLPVAVALIALAAFAAVIWYAYTWGIGGIDTEKLPVIRAEPGPAKVRPESPGGLEVPYQDKLVLNEMTPDPEKPQVERLLPPPESPRPPKAPAAPETGSAVTAGQAPAAAPPSPETPAAAEPPEADTAVPSPPATEAAAESQARTGPAAAPAPPSPDAGTQAAAAPVTGGPSAAVPPGGAFVVQLASLKARDRVEAEWARLQEAHPGLLGDRQLTVQKVDLGSRGTFFRVQAGFFAARAAADRLCARLKAEKQDCLVLRR
ncbi:MAG: SPOR domain-containing protein [Kiloniellaceae bacterium]